MFLKWAISMKEFSGIQALDVRDNWEEGIMDDFTIEYVSG